jgi:hypothetical protein
MSLRRDRASADGASGAGTPRPSIASSSSQESSSSASRAGLPHTGQMGASGSSGRSHVAHLRTPSPFAADVHLPALRAIPPTGRVGSPGAGRAPSAFCFMSGARLRCIQMQYSPRTLVP